MDGVGYIPDNICLRTFWPLFDLFFFPQMSVICTIVKLWFLLSVSGWWNVHWASYISWHVRGMFCLLDGQYISVRHRAGLCRWTDAARWDPTAPPCYILSVQPASCDLVMRRPDGSDIPVLVDGPVLYLSLMLCDWSCANIFIPNYYRKLLPLNS